MTNKLDLTTKKTWADISVGQWQEMSLVQSETEIGKFINLISIALDCDVEDIRNLKISDWQKMKADYEFLNSEPVADFQNFIDFDGVELGLEPDLDLITTGVFIDAEQFRQNSIENLHRTLALIYRPVKEKRSETQYSIEPHTASGFERRAEFFRDRVSIEIVYGAAIFFFILCSQLSIDMADFLKEDLMQTMTDLGI